jgi:hypothetical protein
VVFLGVSLLKGGESQSPGGWDGGHNRKGTGLVPGLRSMQWPKREKLTLKGVCRQGGVKRLSLGKEIDNLGSCKQKSSLIVTIC